MQYAVYLKNVAQGDFGRSIRSKQPVAEEIASRLPATLRVHPGAINLCFGA